MDNLQTPTGGAMPGPKGNGSTVAIIIIILIVALAGAYFWFEERGDAGLGEGEQITANTSDESLEKELELAGEANVEADLQNMDKEFGN